MVPDKPDPVLMAVGIIIVIALITGIVAMAIIPQKTAGITKLNLEGKAFEGISCSNGLGQQGGECNPAQCRGCRDKTGCENTCRKASPSCQRG